jgi:hypothetical protein
MPEISPNPPPEALQFQHAEPLPAAGSGADSGPQCVVCKQPAGNTYFHARGHVVCPACAGRIQSAQQTAPAPSLGRAFVYGAGAALGGCLLYAAVSILTGLEIGLIAIVVGVMVGKAMRHGSRGVGGRPLQILAVILTYFAITTSYIPVILYKVAKNPEFASQRQAKRPPAQDSATATDTVKTRNAPRSFGAAILALLFIAAAAPFISLGSGFSGLITLFIIFIGLQRAWRLTAKSDVQFTGPYQAAPAQ